MNETQKRTIVKILTFRLIALLITALWTGLGNAVIIHLILTIVHYVFERTWLRIKWGTT
jgi:hypothetical protein